MEHTPHLNVMGRNDAPVLVICDAVGQKVYEEGRVLPPLAMTIFANHAQLNGFSVDDFLFATACPPIPESEASSERRITAFLGQYREELWNEVLRKSTAKVVVYLGSLAGKQLFGRPVLITRTAGQIVAMEGLNVPVVGMLSPANVLKRPEVVETFASNFQSLARLRDANYNADTVAQSSISANYEWKTDISDLLARPPNSLALDTETIGYEWFRGSELLTVQMTYQEGHSLVLPVHVPYYEANVGKFGNMEPLTPQKRLVLLQQIRELLANPRVHVSGHNLKYDVHALRMVDIAIANWYADTMQLAFAIDENMQEKSLDECTRRWISRLSGYADAFNRETDKSRMDLVPADKLLPYAGGDTDAAFSLTRLLMRELRNDGRQLKTFLNIQMPSLRAFVKMEQLGVGVDQPTLQTLGTTLEEMETRTYGALIENTPSTVRRLHMDAGLKFSRAAFTADTLFSPQGFGLRPLVFTKGTANTAERVPSVSSKTHLPFFTSFRTGSWATPEGFHAFINEEQTKRADDNKPILTATEIEAERVAGFPYVSKLIDYLKLQKIRSTYVGQPGGMQMVRGRERLVDATGFWQYIAPDGRIHPSFFLHDTVTGRSSSRNPNAQNLPKRGSIAKAFRKIFRPTPGYVLVEADLSQAELRIAAWMANELNMLDIYQRNGDIHTATAAAVMGLSIEAFMQLPEEQIKLLRFYAKAVNFGFLYGMGWRKFKDYAKTEYGVDFTEVQAQELRTKFFQTYPRLENWHASMREFVRRHGYVRSLHGAMRHLPSVFSTDDKVKGEAERQAINSPVQRFASDLGLMAMARLSRDTNWELVRPLMFIHDALVCEVRQDIAEQGAAWVKHYMESNPLMAWFGLTPPLPILSDVSIGHNLGEMREHKDIIAAPAPFLQAHLDF